MQTLTINIKDDFMSEVIKFIETAKDNITIEKDGVPLGCKNLEYDKYFYERRDRLQKIRLESKAGKTEMIEDGEFWEDIDSYVDTLQK
jgi:hypothetical protein